MGEVQVSSVHSSEDLLPLIDGFVRRGSVDRVYQREFSDGTVRWYARIGGDNGVLPTKVQTEKDVAKWWWRTLKP